MNTPSYDFDALRERKSRHHRNISDFKVVRVLGQGSFGKVMLVEDTTSGKRVVT